MNNKIKANELRIGNYVSTTDILIQKHKIEAKDIISIIDGSFEKLGLEVLPIPLTEEWLLMFGFEKKKGFYDRYYYSIDGMVIRVDDDMFETEIGECLYKSIEYVHQLQNLYFALNDKELTMK